jgi:hypothetical protein
MSKVNKDKWKLRIGAALGVFFVAKESLQKVSSGRRLRAFWSEALLSDGKRNGETDDTWRHWV